MARAKSGIGHDTTTGHPGGSRTESRIADESELGSDMQGKNKLHGNDQSKMRDQRQTWPEENATKRRGSETR
jgi:hypothetical protein